VSNPVDFATVENDHSATSAIWVGTYTTDAGGRGEGIYSIDVDSHGLFVPGGLAVNAPSPSFVAVHPTLPIVYAVHEFAGTVSAYRRDAASGLDPVGDAWPTGAAGCHVAVDPGGRYIVVNCWGDGKVVLFELDATGQITARFEAERAVDPHAGSSETGLTGDRQSRAHASIVLDDGRIMSTDLGFDLVRLWHYEPGLGLVAEGAVVLGRGAGPRHLAQHPSGRVYIDTEYSIEVVVLDRTGEGGFAVHSVGSATLGGAQDGDAAAELAFSADYRFIYVGVRGSNRISTLVVEESGRARPVADTPCGGSWPRHHLVFGECLLVANERSGTVAAFKLDADSGVPAAIVGQLSVASPTSLIVAEPRARG
jgi:6-phosphogluconolactonase